MILQKYPDKCPIPTFKKVRTEKPARAPVQKAVVGVDVQVYEV